MKKTLGITAVLLLVAIAACGQPPNPIIGSWKLYSAPNVAPNKYCSTPLVFTSTTQTMTYEGKVTTEKVTYNAEQKAVYPTTVYAMGSGGHTTYIFSSKDKMVMDTALQCEYVRQ